MNRRGFLTSAGTALTVSLSGCTGGLGAGTESSGRGLELPSLDVGGSPGGPISLRPRGKVVLLDFFATWCLPCKPEMENLRAVRSTYSPNDVFVASITQETDEAAIKEFWQDYEGTWPVAMDPDLEATQKYDVTGIPTIIVLTPSGDEVFRHTGLAGEDTLMDEVDAALALAGDE